MPQTSDEIRAKVKVILTQHGLDEPVSGCLMLLEAMGVRNGSRYGYLTANSEAVKAFTPEHWDLLQYLVEEWDFAWKIST